MDKEQESSVLHKHNRDKHQGTVTDYTMNVTGVFGEDAMLRQIAESVKIHRQDQDKIMNSKLSGIMLKFPELILNSAHKSARASL